MKLFDLEDESFSLQTYIEFGEYDFVWFDEPINYYNIEEVAVKISSFEQLRWYAEVFFYLNPDVDLNLFKGFFQTLSNTDFGKTVRSYGRVRTGSMIEDVYKKRITPWCRRKRRLIFNPNVIMSAEEKISISSSLTKRGVVFRKTDLLETINYLNSFNILITNDSLSKNMNCSKATINRLLDNQTKSIIKFNNTMIREETKILKVVECIEILTSGGDDIKVKSLKKLTAERDYDIIKKAIFRFENHL